MCYAPSRKFKAWCRRSSSFPRSEVEPAEFYAALMDKTISALAAVGGVVWIQEEGAPLKLEYQVNLRQTGLAESEEAQLQHGRLLQQVMEKGEPALVQPHSGAGAATEGEEDAAANPTDYLLVVAPIKSDRGVDGLVEVFQRTGARPTTQRGYLRFLSQVCEAGRRVRQDPSSAPFRHKTNPLGTARSVYRTGTSGARLARKRPILSPTKAVD